MSIIITSGSITSVNPIIISGSALTLNAPVTASGIISSSRLGPGFGLIINSASIQYLSASKIDVDAETIRIGGSTFSKTDVDETKAIETKRKSTDGLPLKKIRGFNSASTFIDLSGEDHSLAGSTKAYKKRPNVTLGESVDVFVRNSFEALHVSPQQISLGPKETVPLELTGSLKIRPANSGHHNFDGKYVISGKHGSGNSTAIADNDTVSLSVTGSTVVSGSSGSYNIQNIAYYDISQMSMDITQGGFFGLAVSGTTHASNLANIADFLIDFNQSGSTTFEGGDTTVSQSVDDTLIVSGGNTTIESEFTQSGDSVFTGGDNTFDSGIIFISESGNVVTTQTIDTDITIPGCGVTILNVSSDNPSITIAAGVSYTIQHCAEVTIVNPNQTFTGGPIGSTNVEINEEEIVVGPDTSVGNDGVTFTQIISTNTTAGAGSTTLNVTNENLSITIDQGINYTIPLGANVTIINSNQTFTGGTVDDITVTGDTSLTDLEANDMSIDVTNTTASVDITGSEGSVTLEVSGGNTVINSEFTQSGGSIFTGGANVFEGSASADPSASIGSVTTFVGDLSSSESSSGATVEISGPSGSGELVVDQISIGWDNDIPVTASLTLSNVVHGMGRQVLVCSGSNPLYGIDDYIGISPNHSFYGLPVNTAGRHRANPAGIIRLELPSASVGLSFDIKSKQSSGNTFSSIFPPTILVTPNNSEKFIFNTAGASGTIGKGIQIVSQSMQNNARLHVTCQSGSDWTVINMNGPWTDEP